MDFEEDAFQQARTGHTLSSSTAGSAQMPSPSANQVAEAFERRLREQREQAAAAARAGGYSVFDQDHEKRQEFRRMIDPGIMRPNARPVALESMQTLLKLAENILQHPDEEKYQRFKLTNPNIRRLLVEPKGTLEYARALGFNPEVKKFDQFYVFNNKRKHLQDLRIGSEILREALEREVTKEERAAQAKKEERALAAAQIEKVKRQFYDDRKQQAVRSEIESVANRAPRRQSLSPPTSPRSPPMMPASGRTLGGDNVTIERNVLDDDEE